LQTYHHIIKNTYTVLHLINLYPYYHHLTSSFQVLHSFRIAQSLNYTDLHPVDLWRIHTLQTKRHITIISNQRLAALGLYIHTYRCVLRAILHQLRLNGKRGDTVDTPHDNTQYCTQYGAYTQHQHFPVGTSRFS
jgi:hypothetical protein